MRLLELKLTNIGPYHIQNINFETDVDKNIILICGDNGAGKTTILKAIKLGLFGSTLYGLKENSQSNQYLNDVKSLIRNNAKNGSIAIKFSIVENYIEREYQIIRRWENSRTIKETTEVYVNQKRIMDEKVLIILEYIRENFSPAIIESIIFDGEKIINIIENGELSGYLENLIVNLFGLNNYYAVQNDLNSYIKSFVSSNKMTLEQMKLNDLEIDFKNNKSIIKQKEFENKDLQNRIESLNYNVNNTIDKYSILGGINKKDLTSIKEKFTKSKKIKDDIRQKQKDFLEKNICYLLNEKLYKLAIKQLEYEEPIQYSSYLDIISQSKYISVEDTEILKRIRSKLISVDSKDPILEYGESEKKVLLSYKDKLKIAKKEKKNLFSEVHDEKYIKELREMIKINESDEMISLLDTIKNDEEVIEKLYRVHEQNQTLINQLSKSVFELNLQISEQKSIMFSEIKENNSFVLAKKYIDICEDFIKDELLRITTQISKQCTLLIREIFRKDEYITELILTDNFEVQLYHKDTEKPLIQLSAGEKQLFISAIISSIVKLSKRNLFVIFDTPAGRLDNEHMKRFYELIIGEISKQVIVMPTSKEINTEVLNVIGSKVSRCSTIYYRKKGTSEIIDGEIFEKEWING